MSLDKSIQYGKEYRKPYYGTKAIDPACRCGGSCEWCQQNRQYKNLKKMQKSVDKEFDEWYNEYIEQGKEV